MNGSSTAPVVDSDIKTLNFEAKDVKTTAGWLVMSERYHHFDAWHAYQNGKELPILRANGFVSAIPVDAGTVQFRYESKLFKIGSAIAILTVLGIILYFGYRFWKKRK